MDVYCFAKCFDCSLSRKDVMVPIGEFKRHNELYHSEAPYGCQYCPARFYDEVEKFVHEEGDHMTFPCLRCHRNGIPLMMEREYFPDHFFEEHKDCTFPCSVCPNLFTSQHLADEHYRRWHVNLVTDTKRKCLNCDSFLERKDMRSHNKDCHRGLNFECPKCGNVFYSDGAMKEQKRNCKIWG